MLREVTRQLYSKLTEQTDMYNHLAETKSEGDMRCSRTEMDLETVEQRLRAESNSRAGAEAKLAQLKTDLVQLSAQHSSAVQHADATASRLETEVAAREGLQKRYRRECSSHPRLPCRSLRLARRGDSSASGRGASPCLLPVAEHCRPFAGLHTKFMALSTETSSLLTDLELDNHRTDDEQWYRQGVRSGRGGGGGAGRARRGHRAVTEDDSS